MAFETGEKEKSRGKWKNKRKKRKKESCWICGSNHWKKESSNKKNKKNEKDNSSSNTKSSGISVNTVEEDEDCAFIVEILDDKNNMS